MPERLVLIDTSVWITYFRPGCPPSLLQRVRKCLSEERVVGLPPIWLELLTGANQESTYGMLRDFLKGVPLLALDETLWDVAYHLGFTLRRKAVTVPSMDLTIAAAAIRHGIPLWHQDRHFDLIARHSPLKIFR